MTTITKRQILQSVDKLSPDLFKEAWLFLEFLSFKTASIEPRLESVPSNPEGAFPELDVSLETIGNILNDDRQKRQSRLLTNA
ncbi:MAG: hypothetical protein GY805_18580 [Chloroflexi bacterium]|nr:hypothetical protein [Chloroflexota bacterium]